MKIFHFALITESSPQFGLRDALKGIATDGYAEFSWVPYYRSTGGMSKMRAEFVEQARAFDADLPYCQIQTPDVLNAAVLNQIPGLKVSWGGDCRDGLPSWCTQVAPGIDWMLMSNWRDVNALRDKGIRSDYLQIGFSPSVFTPNGPTRDKTADIVFMGNNYPNRFARSYNRAQMVTALRMRYGKRFAVYGNGWGITDPWLTEEDEAAAYRTCKVAISSEHYHIPGFCSDRIFRATGSGAFVLCDRFPSIADHFEDGKEVVSWVDGAELFKKIDYYLDREQERKEIAAAGCARTHATHSWDCRMKQMLDIVQPERLVAA
jgi:hypothetical protein